MKTKIFTRFLAIAFLLLGSLSAKAQCLSGWQYVVPIAVNNNAGSGLANYQVEVNLPNTATLVSEGHMQSNGNDIRFTDGSCNNLPYWIQKGTFGTSNCIIWVKTITIPANETQTVNMYYGNPSAAAASNGTNTFNLFDDFSNPTQLAHGVTEPNTSIWNINKPSSVTMSVSGGVFTMTNGSNNGSVADITSVANFPSAIIFESDITAISDANSGQSGMGIFNNGGLQGYTLGYSKSAGAMVFGSASSCSGSWGNSDIQSNTNPGSAIGTWGIAWPFTANQYSYWGGSGIGGSSSMSSTASGITISSQVNVGLGILCGSVSATQSVSFDWARVREYTAVPPTATPGPEYSNVVAISGNEMGTCVGSSISIPYTTSGTFNSDNVFTAQLSNASGSFSSPYNIGTVTSTTSGTISATLPAGVTGSGFTIRILSSDPLYTGEPNTTAFAINPLPTASISGSETICYGTTATSIPVSISNTSGYAWSLVYSDGTNNHTLTGTGDGTSYITPSNTATGTTTYSLVSIAETSGTLCSNSASGSATVTVNPLPAALAGSNASITQGGSVQIGGTAVTGSSYAWSPSTGLDNASASNPNASPTSTTTYTVTETNSNGCVNSNSVTVTVNTAVPAINVQGNGNNITAGSVAPTTANATDFGTTTTGSSNETYTIYNNGTGTLNISGESISGTNASNFTVTSVAASTVAAGGGSTPFTVGFTASAAGTYAATVTVGSNDPNTPSYTYAIQAEEILSATTSGTATICSGTSTTLSASSNGDANTTYQWYNSAGAINGATSATYATTETSTDNYYVIATDGNATATSNTVTVTVNPTPVASFSAPAAQCYSASGNTFNFTDGSSVSTGSITGWAWTFGDANSGTSTSQDPSYTYNASGAGTYTVGLTVTSNNGCPSATATETVTVNPLPVTIVNNATIVQGSTVNLGSASNNTSDTYSWIGSNIPNPNSSNPVVAPVSTSTYTVTETTPSSCSATTTVTITVTPLTISISGNATICSGGSSVLTASTNGPNIQWYYNGGAISSATGSTYTATQAGNYYASTTNGSKTVPSNSITLVVNPNGTASISGGGSICSGGSGSISMAITAGTGVSWTFYYTINGVSNSQTGTGNGAGGGSYNNLTTTQTFVPVSLVVSTGCPTSVSGGATITVNPLPAAYVGSNVPMFAGSSVTIGGASVSGDSYSWSPSTGLSSATVSNPTASPASTTTYTLTETTASNCKASNSVQVSVVPLPTITPETTTSFCHGGSVVLDATNYGANANANYQWYVGSSNSVALATAISGATSISYTATASGYYFVNAYGGNPVISGYSGGTQVTVNPLPTASISGSTTICYGTTAPTITIPVANTGGSAWSLVYSNGASNTAVTGTGNGTASITASNTATTTYSLVSISETSGNGCSNTLSGSATVTVNALPAANAGSNVTIASGSSAKIGGTAVSGSTYVWSPSTGLSSATCANPTASPSSTTTYTVTEENSNGCYKSNTVTVTVVYPAINVQGNGTNIAAGSTTVSTSNATNFGTTATGSSTETYTVQNKGAAALTISSVSIGGANASDFSVTSSPASSVSAGGSTTFTVTFAASATGTYNGTVTVNSNDPNTKAYTYAIQAATLNPVISANGNTSFCDGDSVLLTSTAGPNYQWNDADGPIAGANSQTFYADYSSTFYVTMTNGSMTGTSNTIDVTVNPLPAANTGNASAICVGGSATIGATAVSGDTYSWSSSPTDNTLNSSIAEPTVSPSQSTTYTLLEVVKATGCSNSNSVTVNVNPLPAADAGSNQTILAGGSVGIGNTAVGDDTYSWSPSTGLSSSTVANPVASPAATTTYTLTEGNDNGCTASHTVTVTVTPITVTAGSGSATSFCPGGSVTLTATSNASAFQWYNASGAISGAVNATYTASATGSYYAVASNNSASQKSNTVSVTVYSLPVANAGPDVNTCQGSSASIGTSAISGDSYSWSSYAPSTGVTTSIGSTSAVATVAPSLTTIYVVYVTNNTTGCVNSDTMVVNVNPLPAANAGSSQTITSGSSTSIGGTAVGSDVYSWTSSPSGFTSSSANPTVAPTVTTTYTVTETNPATGCKASNTVTITVTTAAKPTICITGSTTFCAGGSVKLTASTGTSYQWSNAGGNISGATSQTYYATVSGTYYVTVTTKGVSATSAGVTVTVIAAPAAYVGSSQSICAGNSVSLGTTAVSGDTYVWTTSNGGSCGGSNKLSTSSQITVTPGATTTYTLTETNKNGCSASNSATITVVAKPCVSLSAFGSVCASAGTFTLSGGSPAGGVYTVDGKSATTFNPSAESTGSHTITYTYTNSTGCSATATQYITVSPAVAQPTITSSGSLTICSGTTLKLTASESGNYGCGSQISYQWSNQNGPLMGCGYSSQSINVSASGTYYVTVSVNGCSNTSKGVTVTVNPTPTASTCGNINYNYGYDNDPVISASCNQSNCSFKWSCGASTQSCTVAPTCNTTYYCTATANGCASAPASCTVYVNDCHDYNYNDPQHNNECSMCYYNSQKKQYCQYYVSKCNVPTEEKCGYTLGNCNAGANLANVSADQINVFPNPFSTTTSIRVNFVQDEQVKVDVISMEGRVVSTLYEGSVSSGMPYNFTFDGTPFMSGIYMVRVISGETVQIRKIDLLKN